MEKLTVNQINTLEKLLRNNGAVPKSNFTTGMGRHSRRAKLIVGHTEIFERDVNPENWPVHVKNVFDSSPYTKRVVGLISIDKSKTAIDNCNKAKQEKQEKTKLRDEKRKNIKKFKIHITDRHSATVHIDVTKPIDENGTLPRDYDGFDHNFNGIVGYAVERAVKKLFGNTAYWFGSYDNVYSGQVFRPSRYEDQHVSTSLTSREYIDFEEIK